MKVSNNDSILDIEKTCEEVKSLDVATQCQLTIQNENLPPKFSITEARRRRSFVRKVYGLLILQNFISFFAMEVVLCTTFEPISKAVYSMSAIFILFAFLLIYFIRGQRRIKPLNYLFFVITTLLYITETVIFTMMTNTQLVTLYPGCIILQLNFLILYSKLFFLRFTYWRGVIIIFMACSLFLICIYYWSTGMIMSILLRSFIAGCYIIYDTHLMITGQHGYQVDANEYVFGATNIFADWAIFLWRLFRFLFVDHLIVIGKFLIKCCKTEVC